MSVATRPRAAWLTQDLLLIARPTGAAPDGPPTLVGEEHSTIRLEAGPFEAPPSNGTSSVAVSICRLTAPTARRSVSDFSIEQGGETFRLDADGFPEGNDLQSILRTELAGLDESTRDELMRFILTAVGDDLHGPGGLVLAKKMAQIRDVLRERLPYCIVREDEPLGLRIDEIHALDDRTFWIKGWLWDVDTPLESLTFISPEGCSVEVLHSAYRYRRLDIEQIYANTYGERPDSGFLACVELDVPSRLTNGWVAQLRNVLGAGVEVTAPPATRGLGGARIAILRDLDDVGQAREKLVADHVRPAITAVQRRIAATTTVERDEWYGSPPENPDVSIIVPLGRSDDSLQQQLTHLGRDPEMSRAELIYLVGAARLSADLIAKGEELQWLYGVPFRLVSLSQMDRATSKMNIGASLATARDLLFMSPDTFADEPGWLSTLLSFKSERPDAGAIGPKLIHEDGSVHHAGLYFDRVSRHEIRSLEPPDSAIWELRYRFSGMPENFGTVNEPTPVAAVSEAALLVDRESFDEAGGFQNIFLAPDYEAADLCLRLEKVGRTNWYVPDARLHYLEGRSELEVPVPESSYDVMLCSQLWGERIEALTK